MTLIRKLLGIICWRCGNEKLFLGRWKGAAGWFYAVPVFECSVCKGGRRWMKRTLEVIGLPLAVIPGIILGLLV